MSACYYTNLLLRICLLTGLLSVWHSADAQQSKPNADKLGFKCTAESDVATAEWLHILTTRNSRPDDPTAHLSKSFTAAEADWYTLITSRKAIWEQMADSLARPFAGITIDKVAILAGSRGVDDAFTYGHDYICFDMSVLGKNYGDARSAENIDRIDRLFAHEMTHLFHKALMKNHHITLRTFRDSVLWECIYEGLGTYRSLSKKWLPECDSLPSVTEKALQVLLPEFLTNIEKACNADSLSIAQKADITRYLSRGAISKKWGAFTIAIWIAQFVGDKQEKLKAIVEWGIDAPIMLASKNIPSDNAQLRNLRECVWK